MKEIEKKNTSITPIIISNAFVLFGIFFFKWKAADILIIYWIESIIIGVFGVLKILTLKTTGTKFSKVTLTITKITYSIFSLFQYLVFMGGHLIFIIFLFYGVKPGGSIKFTEISLKEIFSDKIFNSIVLLITHLISFINNHFTLKEREKLTPQKLIFMPIKRIFLMQTNILLGSALAVSLKLENSMIIVTLLTVIKTVLDIQSHNKIHKNKDSENTIPNYNFIDTEETGAIGEENNIHQIRDIINVLRFIPFIIFIIFVSAFMVPAFIKSDQTVIQQNGNYIVQNKPTVYTNTEPTNKITQSSNSYPNKENEDVNNPESPFSHYYECQPSELGECSCYIDHNIGWASYSFSYPNKYKVKGVGALGTDVALVDIYNKNLPDTVENWKLLIYLHKIETPKVQDVPAENYLEIEFPSSKDLESPPSKFINQNETIQLIRVVKMENVIEDEKNKDVLEVTTTTKDNSYIYYIFDYPDTFEEPAENYTYFFILKFNYNLEEPFRKDILKTFRVNKMD